MSIQEHVNSLKHAVVGLNSISYFDIARGSKRSIKTEDYLMGDTDEVLQGVLENIQRTANLANRLRSGLSSEDRSAQAESIHELASMTLELLNETSRKAKEAEVQLGAMELMDLDKVREVAESILQSPR